MNLPRARTSGPGRRRGLRRVAHLALPLAGALALVGCGSRQSTLEPESKASRDIAHLWWIMMTGAWVVFGVVVVLLAVAVLRRRSLRAMPGGDRGASGLVFFGGVLAPIVVLSLLFALTVRTLPATSAPKQGKSALTVEVIGHQWFWEVRYPGTRAVTANEIHIPARTPVRLEARTGDVIHSFWVPELNRKIDMIPGRTNSILLRADEPGVYRGQCAELCGVQHAHMVFLVFADPPAQFRAWLRRQAQPATARGRGRSVFLTAGCAACHSIRGTAARGAIGPDLTHLAGRRTLAAATIPNRKGYLAGWILDPQHVKPGNKMPALDLSGPDLQALLDYLQALR